MKVEFLNCPALTPVGNGDGWRLLEDFYVRIDSESGDAPWEITIPAGFETDLASVPRLPGAYLLFGNKARRSAILHDHLYGDKWPRESADLAFREAMKQEVGTFTRYAMWLAVRVGGGAYYAERTGPSNINPETERQAP